MDRDIVIQRIYKNQFPFKLATTSFIYPDTYAANVARLASFFDEIELLFFDGADPTGLPEPAEIRQLGALAATHGMTYNIHLPTDVSLTDPDPAIRSSAIDVIVRVVERVTPLFPRSYTLHLAPSPLPFSPDEMNQRRTWTLEATQKLFDHFKIAPAMICVENIETPFSFEAPIIEALGLSVCLDIGHLVLYGHDLDAVFRRWLPLTKVIHLHGVSGGRDHRELAVMDPNLLKQIMGWLKRFDGTVCLEVFSIEALRGSLTVFEAAWEGR